MLDALPQRLEVKVKLRRQRLEVLRKTQFNLSPLVTADTGVLRVQAHIMQIIQIRKQI